MTVSVQKSRFLSKKTSRFFKIGPKPQAISLKFCIKTPETVLQQSAQAFGLKYVFHFSVIFFILHFSFHYSAYYIHCQELRFSGFALLFIAYQYLESKVHSISLESLLHSLCFAGLVFLPLLVFPATSPLKMVISKANKCPEGTQMWPSASAMVARPLTHPKR